MFVQVVQDVVCSWCRIGKRNLDTALKQWRDEGGEAIDVQWFPFLLDPIEKGANEGFVERFVERKGLSQDQVAGMWANVGRAGAAVGLTFHFDRIEKAVSTIPAHELVALTPVDQQSAVIDVLHTAYFERGANIESTDVLVEIAREAGLANLEQLRADLEAGTREADVRAMIAQAQQASIQGVPFFIVDGKLGLSGAQPAEAILGALRKAAGREVSV